MKDALFKTSKKETATNAIIDKVNINNKRKRADAIINEVIINDQRKRVKQMKKMRQRIINFI